MSREQVRAAADAVGLHLLRLVVMLVASQLAAFVGIDGWYRGLAVNVVVTAYAVWLVHRRGLWHRIGVLRAWSSWPALVLLVPLAFEATLWALPAGLVDDEPGFPLWGLTLLLVGVNEELVSRAVVPSRLSGAFQPVWAVTGTAALFGLQHLSAFLLTSRQAGDILGNVGLSAVEGFALAAFQWRFRWLWPLILVHAWADFTTILAARPLPDAVVAVDHVALVLFGLAVLFWPRPRTTPHGVADGSPAHPPARDAPTSRGAHGDAGW